jgi:hypothetical protein
MYTRLFFHRQRRWNKGTRCPSTQVQVAGTYLTYLSRYIHALANSKRDDAVQVRACCLRKKASSSHHASARAAIVDDGEDMEQQRQPQQAETGHTPLLEESCGMNSMHVRNVTHPPEPLTASSHAL